MHLTKPEFLISFLQQKENEITYKSLQDRNEKSHNQIFQKFKTYKRKKKFTWLNETDP